MCEAVGHPVERAAARRASARCASATSPRASRAGSPSARSSACARPARAAHDPRPHASVRPARRHHRRPPTTPRRILGATERADARDHGAQRARPGRRRRAASSRSPRTSTPSSRPSPRAGMGFERVPLLCAREIAGPGLAAARHPGADPLLRRRATTTPSTSTSASRAALRADLEARAVSPMAIEFSDRVRRIPVYPAARGYALPEDVALLASNESPDPPLPRGRRGASRGRCAASTAIPTRRTRRCAARCRDRYGVPADADRDRQRLLRHPARRRRGAARARAPSSSTPGRRSPSTRTWRPLGRDARSGAAQRPTTSTTSTAMAAEITAATRLVDRLQPEQPDLDRAARSTTIAAFVERVPRHVCVLLDEAYCEFNTLDDPDASIELLAQAPQPRAAAHVLEGLRALRAARRLRAVRVGRVPHRRRPGPPAVLLQRRRPGRRGRGAAAPGRRRRARRARGRRAPRARGRPARARHRAAESQANFSWFDLPGERRGRASRSSRRSAERGVLVRAGAALGAPGCLRVTYGTPQENDRFLAALASCSPSAPRDALRLATARPCAQAMQRRRSGPRAMTTYRARVPSAASLRLAI